MTNYGSPLSTFLSHHTPKQFLIFFSFLIALLLLLLVSVECVREKLKVFWSIGEWMCESEMCGHQYTRTCRQADRLFFIAGHLDFWSHRQPVSELDIWIREHTDRHLRVLRNNHVLAFLKIIFSKTQTHKTARLLYLWNTVVSPTVLEIWNCL